MNKKELPIGSVVLLDGATRKVMITGYRSKSDDSDTIYDYNGILFPEGLMENIYTLFNADEIVEIFYEGLKNEEYEHHIDRINGVEVGDVISFDNKTVEEGRRKRGRTPKEPTKPLSISEMRARYTKQKISGGQTEVFDFSKYKDR